jgi:hypothetical protein
VLLVFEPLIAPTGDAVRARVHELHSKGSEVRAYSGEVGHRFRWMWSSVGESDAG